MRRHLAALTPAEPTAEEAAAVAALREFIDDEDAYHRERAVRLMPFGPGKYDDACAAARRATGGGVLLIVFNGDRGIEFSAQVTADMLAEIPDVLRRVAEQIERDGQA